MTVDAPGPALGVLPRARRRERRRSAAPLGRFTGPVVGMVVALLLLAGLAAVAGLARAGWIAGMGCAVVVNGALAIGVLRYRTSSLGPAGWVTLTRATLAVGVAALVADSFVQPAEVTVLVSIATLALMLDALDGWVARRTGTEAALGARFDGEVDAFLILVLSVYVARSAGAWVLAIGAARYVFLVAGWLLPRLRQTLPPRRWRKVVAATQGIVLTLAAAHILPLALIQLLLLAALLLLAESFGRDVRWLWTGGRRASAHPGFAGALTMLAGLIVWIALVAPDRPASLTPAALLRIPLEGLVLIAVAVFLPVVPRRALAALLGLVLGLVVILKALDIGFVMTFERPFDLIGDSGSAGIGLETLRAAVGRTQTDLIVAGLVSGVVALLIIIPAATMRLTRVAAAHRGFSLRAVAALGTVWLGCWLASAHFVSHNPIAATSAAGVVVGEVRAVQADIRDEGVFASQIRHDQFAYTPGSRLLTGLRGKDVLLVFVESYGRVSVQGSSFSPAVDRLLDSGTSRLRAAGFSARTAFVTSSTFAGVSWLAHSTLQSGVWANTQQRYNQLVSTHRFTLSQAFGRAGWRTVVDSPADDRVWPQGSTFYHYDKIYDRRDVGYRGPTFTYASMPDQYLYLGLQRLELSKTHRRPVFAEVDTVSSHMPWNRIPRMVPWQAVGSGSIFNRVPVDKNLDGQFWVTPRRVRAAYARSIEYSLNALISYVQRYGRKNLVLVVVGDEQPLPIVSGQGASHDVPISVISHDSSVLKRIAGWGWSDGLRPRSSAPVWPMSAFRDRFLTAFDTAPAPR